MPRRCGPKKWELVALFLAATIRRILYGIETGIVFFKRAFDNSISSYFDPACGAGDLILAAKHDPGAPYLAALRIAVLGS